MNKNIFDIKVKEWNESLHKELLACGDFKHEDFENGDSPDHDFFEVYWEEVLGDGAFTNDGCAYHELRNWIPDEIIKRNDADVLAECQFDENIDLGFMYRIATNDSFREYLMLEFEKNYCKVVERG